MHYPLIDRQLFPPLRLVHGGYNFTVVLLFLYHGWLGIRIRRARKAHGPLPFPAIKRHRKGGPVLAVMGVLGFFIGFTLVMLHTGNVLEYPLHFLVACMIVLLIVSTVIVSVRIKGQESPYRTPHFVIGVTILTLYVIEVFLGIGVLF
jgi:hypothetical protein